MKKIVALILAVVMIACMVAACGESGSTPTTGANGTTTGNGGTTQDTTAEPTVPKDESLLVWLDFSFDNLDESGDKPYFFDMSGNGNHGYLGGDMDVTSSANDDLGDALAVVSIGDYLTIKHNDAFNFKAEDNFSVEFWYQVDTDKIYSHNSWPCLFTKGSPNATSYFGSWMNMAKNGKTSLYFGTGTFDIENNENITGNKNAAAFTGALDDNWHHFVAVQKDGTIYTYIDGVAGAIETAKDVSNTWDIYVGGKVGEAEGQDKIQQFFGAIDEFKIYNRALSYQEITGIEVEYPEKEELVLDLDFTKLANGVINDLTGKGHNGTVTGNVTVTEGGAKFDASAETGSYITIPNAADLQFKRNQSFTFEITFKYDTLPTGWTCLYQSGLKGQGWYGVWGAGGSKMAWGGIGGNKYATKTALTEGTWHTITVVQNAETGEVQTYFDGVAGEKLSAQNYVFDGNIYIGSEISVTAGEVSGIGCKFDGEIKSVKIYNYAKDMTAAQ